MNKATLLGIGALFFWAVNASLLVMAGAIPPFELSFLIFVVGFFCLLLAEKLRGEKLGPLFSQPLRIYLFGATGIGLYTILLCLSFKLAPPFVANALNYTWPILLALFAALEQKRKMAPEEIAGLLMGFIGALVLFAGRGGAPLPNAQADILAGGLVALAAGLVWASYSALARRVQYPAGTVAVFCLLSALPALALHVAFETTVIPAGLLSWFFIALLGAVLSSYSLWDYAMKHGDRNLLASLSYLVPLASTLLLAAFGFIGKEPGIAAGGALIVAGCLVVNGRKILKLPSAKKHLPP